MSTAPTQPLRSVRWFPSPEPPTQAPRGRLIATTLAKTAVAVVAGLVLRRAQHPTLAVGVWIGGGAIGMASLASDRARVAIDGAFARLGRVLGTAIGAVVLSFVYLAIITPIRLARRLLGADDLHLRDDGRRSYWLPCDDEARKARWAGAMFATEAPRAGGRPLRTFVFTLVALLALAEGILRTQGFGDAPLYVADPIVGYYPLPNTTLRRYGGTVSTNAFGMRSPPVDPKKPAGVFRILMLGDSTLFGGSYVDQEELYATQVQRRLEARGLPGRVEVLAMGCNGWGPFHERGYVERFGTFEADLVTIQLPIDDVDRPHYGLMNVPFFAAQTPPRLALEEVFGHLVWRYRAPRAGMDAAFQDQQAPLGIRAYGELTDLLQKAGSEVMFFVLPPRIPGMGGPEDQREAPRRAALEAEVAKRGVKSFYPQGLFAGHGTADAMYHDYGHLNPAGHRVYAGFLEARIVSDSARFQRWAGGVKP
ncbi:MAG: SGNH/GDSL hydrolase family protein [Minicystis sp.]